MTAEESDESRKCTGMRWVIEVVNDRIKNFRILRHRFPIHRLGLLTDIVYIAAMVSNRYHRPLA